MGNSEQDMAKDGRNKAKLGDAAHLESNLDVESLSSSEGAEGVRGAIGVNLHKLSSAEKKLAAFTEMKTTLSEEEEVVIGGE